MNVPNECPYISNDISLCLYDISAQFENGTYFILLYPYTALLPISSSMRNN